MAEADKFLCVSDDFNEKTLYQPFLVSVYTTVAATVLGLLLTTLAAYVILQKEMPGRHLLIAYILFTMLFNGGMIPTYLNIKNLGLMNNLMVVIIPAGLSTYNIVLMRSFLKAFHPLCMRRQSWMGVRH